MVKRVMLSRPPRSADAPTYVKNKKSAGVEGGGWSPLKGDQPPPNPPASPGAEKKKKANVDDLLTQADTLSAADRKTLLAKLALQAAVGVDGQTRDVDMWAQSVYDGLVATLGYEDGAAMGPMVVKRLVGSPSAWAPVAQFMADSRLDQLKVVERQSVYMMLALLVIDKAKYVASKSNATLGPKLVSTCAAGIAGVFDAAFPGYLASGLAPMVAKQLTAQR